MSRRAWAAYRARNPRRRAPRARARCAGLIRPAADLACGPLHPPDSHSRWTEERGPPTSSRPGRRWLCRSIIRLDGRHRQPA